MFPVGLAVSGVTSLLGGLGAKRRTNPYEGQINSGIGALRGVGSQYAGMASQAGQDVSFYRPQAQAAVGGFADYLRRQTGPASDTERASLVARSAAGVDAAYNRGASQLSADLARRGVTDSSAMSGGLSALAGQRANAYAGATADANQQFDARQASAFQQLVQLLGGFENEAYARQQAGIVGQGQAASNVLGALGQQSSQWQQNESERYGGLMNLLGGLGANAGLLAGQGNPIDYLQKSAFAEDPSGSSRVLPRVVAPTTIPLFKRG